uniref:Uncharacterized protein n=1 Tax=Romanomermis culicivorax TaxID=13658 RepID=A0A915JG94_ROMCU
MTATQKLAWLFRIYRLMFNFRGYDYMLTGRISGLPLYHCSTELQFVRQELEQSRFGVQEVNTIDDDWKFRNVISICFIAN